MHVVLLNRTFKKIFNSFSGLKLLASQNAYLNDFAGIHAKLLQSWPTLCDPVDYSHQALLSLELSRQEYWSGLSFPSPGDLPDARIKPTSPALLNTLSSLLCHLNYWRSCGCMCVCVYIYIYMSISISPITALTSVRKTYGTFWRNTSLGMLSNQLYTEWPWV